MPRAHTVVIGGQGELPGLVADGAHAQGRRVLGIALKGHAAESFASHCDEFIVAGAMRPGGWLRAARRFGSDDAVLIGGVSKGHMHKKGRLARMLAGVPDLYAINLWYRRLRHDHRTSVLLTTLANDLDNRGLHLVDSTTYLTEHLASDGVMTTVEPSALALGDIEFAWPMLRETSTLHIGQSIGVHDRDIISVEAAEGTSAMIERSGSLCPRGGWTLLKTAAPDHDMRVDVPTIGLETIECAKLAGCRCIALGTGRVILADKPAVLAAAEKAGIAIVGVAS